MLKLDSVKAISQKNKTQFVQISHFSEEYDRAGLARVRKLPRTGKIQSEREATGPED